MYRRILSPSIVKIPLVSPRQEVVQALETWRSETEGTYSCLVENLNKYSVFTVYVFNLLPLDTVKNAVIAITADWYSLAIQLDIGYKTRKVEM